MQAGVKPGGNIFLTIRTNGFGFFSSPGLQKLETMQRKEQQAQSAIYICILIWFLAFWLGRAAGLL